MDHFSAHQTLRLERPTNDERELLVAAQDLFTKLFTRRVAIRHVGVNVTNLEADRRQNELFDTDANRRWYLNREVDRVRGRYGWNAVYYGKGLELREHYATKTMGWCCPRRVCRDNLFISISIHSEINAIHFAHMSAYIDENPDYWDDYDNLQRVKHQLLKGYLGGWFPILGSWSGRIVYIDCNAGRGKHKTGQPGSPLIAITTFLGHPFRERILKKCEVSFFFIEADKENQQNLEKIMTAIKRPPKVSVTTKLGEFEAIISEEIKHLKAQNAQLAPAFVFVDPYGFRLPGKLLAQLKAFEKCELFITFMWRWIDMAIRHPEQAENMDALFITQSGDRF